LDLARHFYRRDVSVGMLLRDRFREESDGCCSGKDEFANRPNSDAGNFGGRAGAEEEREAMTTREHIARCDLEIQNCRNAALAATTDSERYGQTWGEVDWLVAKREFPVSVRKAGRSAFFLS
jgi:hypothetical protein